jgi:hypothetical protein
MIYVIRQYGVDPANFVAFTETFERDAPWQRLSFQRDGHLHTGLLVRSTLQPSFLSLAIWQTEQHCLAAEATAEFRDFNRLLRLLSVSYQSAGMFRYMFQPQPEEVPGPMGRNSTARSFQSVRQ